MRPDDSTDTGDWFRLAERDLVRVERSLNHDDPSLAGFCLQQAVEKMLKGFLLLHGRPLRRIHDLEALLEDALTLDPSLEPSRSACQTITGYYMIERYPLIGQDTVTAPDVQAAYNAMLPLLNHLRPPRPT